MTIFKTPELYPDDFTPFLSHFHEFDKVFIAFSPFVQINDGYQGAKTAYQATTFQKAVIDMPILESLEPNLASIYGLNEEYPTDEEIAEKGEAYLWQTIVSHTKLQDIRALHTGLMTQLGRLRKEFQRIDLAEILNEYVNKNNLWYPTEGIFNYFTRKAIYDCLKELNEWSIYAETEFYDEKVQLNLNLIDKNEFIEIIEKYKYIYTFDKKLLFSIDWDSCFFIIAIKSINSAVIEQYFEGFWASTQDNHLWTWDKSELEFIKSL